MTEGLPGAGLVPRYLLAGGPSASVERRVDVLVVGAGIAGLTVALSLPQRLRVEVALKGRAPRPGIGARTDADGSTGRAQGGIAAVLGADDSARLHLEDTLAAGAGLCDVGAVRTLVEEAPSAIDFLQSQGVRLDAPGGHLDLTREGGHSRRRVVHAGGDATGHELMQGLIGAATIRGVHLAEDAFLVDLLTDDSGAACGGLLLEGRRLRVVYAGAVVLATGGFGQLYADTTSPPVCTGDGLAAAFRAGAALADLEFVQFHPTAIQLASDPRPLATEALRGEGAVIRDGDGRAVMEGFDRADLAPRDVVSRQMAFAMQSSGAEHLFLDATAIGSQLAERFPSFVGASHRAGVDPLASWVPVAPAVHYVMGGVRTDLSGRTSLPGLYAVGEVADSGVHGANRLASNSLLEGIVFGRRAADALVGELVGAAPDRRVPDPFSVERFDRAQLRRAMTADAGLLRQGDRLEHLQRALGSAVVLGDRPSLAELEEANLLLIGRLLVAAALRRTESRGAHFRVDLPASSSDWELRQLVHRSVDGAVNLEEQQLDRVAPESGTRSNGVG